MLAAVTCGPIGFINEALVYWRRHPQATSYLSGSRYSLLKGLVSAVQTLNNTDKRKITQRYFMALSDYPFTDYASAKIIRCMKKGNLWGILQSCMLCCHNRKQLYPYHNPLQSCIKSFSHHCISFATAASSSSVKIVRI